jgi:L,D-peptidoglycan transpeptidase YkuD (ErfK/YbiS/YcfS/YnhG family)
MVRRSRPLSVAVALALACGCGKSSSSSSKPPPDEDKPAPTPKPAADAAPAELPSPIPVESRQLVLALSRSWAAPEVTLIRYDREGEESDWDQVGEPISATLGHKGMGWGIGLHGAHAPPRLNGPIKTEGDGRSPAGLFRLGPAFGYAAAPPKGTAIDYVQVTDSWRCVDDPASPRYNLVFSAAEIGKRERDWESAETMRRRDDLYRWGILVDHNGLELGTSRETTARGGGGSCIFLHVWREAGSPTVGCAAMERGALEELIAWLRPQHAPVIAMLPAPQYAKLKQRWRLPDAAVE